MTELKCTLCGATNEDEAGDSCKIGCPMPEGAFDEALKTQVVRRVFVVLEWAAHEGGEFITACSTLPKAINAIKETIADSEATDIGIAWKGRMGSDWGYWIIEQIVDGEAVMTYDHEGRKIR